MSLATWINIDNVERVRLGTLLADELDGVDWSKSSVSIL